MRYICSAVLGVLLLSTAVADTSVPESPIEVLSELIRSEPLLFRLFSDSQPESTNDRRAEVLTESEGVRHVAIVFKYLGDSKERNRQLTKKLCNAALIRPEFKILEHKVREWTTDDIIYREIYHRSGASVTLLTLRDVSLRAPDGWSGHQCSVPIEHITVVEPQLDQSMVLQVIYDLGKQLLVENNNNDALTYLESLENEPEHAMNAALLISVIYQSMNTDFAELYRTQLVDLE